MSSKKDFHLLVCKQSRYQKNIEKLIDRDLACEGVIVVKEGQELSLADVIGEAYVSRGYRIFNVAEILKVVPFEVKELLRKEIGTKVFKDELLAEKKSFLKIITRQFVCPCDGVLENLNETNGQLTIRFLPKKVRLLSGFYGLVVEVRQNKGIVVKTQVHSVKSKLGVGIQREGVLKIVKTLKEEVSAIDITVDCAQKIIWTGGLITRDMVQKSIALGVKGIIGSGINFRDFRSLSSSLNPKEDAGVSLLILNGFGKSGYDMEVLNLLEQYQNRHVIIDPLSRELLIPLSPAEWSRKVKRINKDEELLSIKRGDEVVIIAAPYLGKRAVIKEIHEEEVQLNSLIKTKCALVEFMDKNKILLPIYNMEKLQNKVS